MERKNPRSAPGLASLACVLALLTYGGLACGASDDDTGDTVPANTVRSPGGSGTSTLPMQPPSANSASPTAGAGGGALPASVSDGDVLGELDAEAALGVCDALEARFASTFSDADAERLACALFGVLFSAVSDGSGDATIDVEACRQLEQECISGDGEVTSMSQCDAAGFADAAAACPLTVGAYADCFEAQVAALVELFGVVSCDAPADSAVLDAAMLGGDPSTLPECAAFADQCPELVTSAEDTTGASSGTPAADGCDETCVFAGDGECDDGGSGSSTPFCALGTDCADCGPR